MSENKPKNVILLRDEGGIQTFRDLETGEEFSTTISKLIPEIDRDPRQAKVNCVIRTDRELAQQIRSVMSVIGPAATLNSREMLVEARASGLVTIRSLRFWRAEEIAEALRRIGFSAEVLPE